MAAHVKMKIDWGKVGTEWLPFADAATPELPLKRLLRLSLFQISVAMSLVLLTGTLNRVMIVELHMPAWIVSALVAVPLIMAPIRALIGHKSDTHQSILGWRRVPYIWAGTMLQFGGFAIMPFAILILSGDNTGWVLPGELGAGLAFLLVGAGMHTAQTAGLALATDLAPEDARPRVVALLYVMLLVGTFVTALVIGRLLQHFTPVRLVQVIQGVAALTLILNVVALWKQEPRSTNRFQIVASSAPGFGATWRAFVSHGRTARLLAAVGLGTAAFSMQDVLLEPFGGQVFGLTVGGTTTLLALWAGGALGGFALAARRLNAGADPHRLAGNGVTIGLAAFVIVLMAAPIASVGTLRLGAAAIGFSGGLFLVGTLTAAMALAKRGDGGLACGAWGAVHASALGLAVLIGGALRDVITHLAARGALGPALTGPATGYASVYLLEIFLLFGTLAAIGPLARRETLADATPHPCPQPDPGLAGLMA